MISKALALAIPLMVTAFTMGGGEAQFNKRVPIRSKGTSAYYIEGHIEGFGTTQLLVDTGSGYTTINEETLAVLQQSGRARYLRNLSGIMADGSRKTIPIYLISGINLGGECMIRDIEAAVFPAKTRLILGLATLSRVSPFIFSLDPPSLLLSCGALTSRLTSRQGEA